MVAYIGEKEDGFALTELFLVIAIITSLVAILVLVVNRARELGQRAVCLSNLKQLTLAWDLYVEDNDGWLVRGSAYGLARSWSPLWISKGRAGYRCPGQRPKLVRAPLDQRDPAKDWAN